MLPSQAKPEPTNFDARVRQPGNIFLTITPNPRDNEWRGKEYWQRSLPDLRHLHLAICNYCSTWIPHSTGSHSVDHFLAKNVFPSLAYEWTNFRYVSTRFNSRKGISRIVDPFNMGHNWFIIDFASFFIKPNLDHLDDDEVNLVIETIDVLHFNDDEELVKERMTYYQDYTSREITFEYLERRAPFIAYEIIRQNLRML